MATPNETAQQVLETTPLVMRAIRHEMRAQRQPELSTPQFRALIYLNRNEGASLSDVASHLGLTLPSISRMVDGLVVRGLVSREMNPGDRRRVILTPTDMGRDVMREAYSVTQSRLAERLAALPEHELTGIIRAMRTLESIFTPLPKTVSRQVSE